MTDQATEEPTTDVTLRVQAADIIRKHILAAAGRKEGLVFISNTTLQAVIEALARPATVIAADAWRVAHKRWRERAIDAEKALQTAGFTQEKAGQWIPPAPLMPAEPDELKPGERVVLRSGSRPMTLTDVESPEAGVTFWCDKEDMLIKQRVALVGLERAK